MGMINLSTESRAILMEIAKMSYGTREGASGGKGHMGLLNGVGGARIVKFDTTGGTSRSAEAATSSNALRTLLLSLAKGANLSSPVLADIRRKLGLNEAGAVVAGKPLLERKVVASVIEKIAGPAIWRKVQSTFDRAAYKSAKGNTFESVKAASQGERGRQIVTNNAKIISAVSTNGRETLARVVNQELDRFLGFSARCGAGEAACGKAYKALFGEAFLSRLETSGKLSLVTEHELTALVRRAAARLLAAYNPSARAGLDEARSYLGEEEFAKSGIENDLSLFAWCREQNARCGGAEESDLAAAVLGRIFGRELFSASNGPVETKSVTFRDGHRDETQQVRGSKAALAALEDALVDLQTAGQNGEKMDFGAALARCARIKVSGENAAADKQEVLGLLGVAEDARLDTSIGLLINLKAELHTAFNLLTNANVEFDPSDQKFLKFMRRLASIKANGAESALAMKMLAAAARTPEGRERLRLIANLPAFRELNRAQTAFGVIPEVGKGFLKAFMDQISILGGRRPSAAVYPKLFPHNERRLFCMTYPKATVKKVLSQFPPQRFLGNVMKPGEGAPKGIKETRRFLLNSLDPYKNLERLERENDAMYDEHGRTHATRVFIFGNVLGNILREKGLNVDVNAVAMMGAGHDGGRRDNSVDIYENASAEITRNQVKVDFPGAGDAYADAVADAITTDDYTASTMEAYLLHCADSLDFWRVDVLDKDFFPFLREDVTGYDGHGGEITVKADPDLREQLNRESYELMRLTHEKSKILREMERLERNGQEDTEEYRKLQEEINSDAMRERWNARMERSNEEVVSSIEQVIRDNPAKFPLLTKYYLNQIEDETSLDGIRGLLIPGEGKKVDTAGVKVWLSRLDAQWQRLYDKEYEADVVIDASARTRCDNTIAQRLQEHVHSLSNEDLSLMFQSLVGTEMENLREELSHTSKRNLGFLLDLEAAVASEVAKRHHAAEVARLDGNGQNPQPAQNGAAGDISPQSAATLVDTAAKGSVMAEGMTGSYNRKIEAAKLRQPVNIHQIGDKLRSLDLSINFRPEYLFGDLTMGCPEQFPIDQGDHVYKSLFRILEDHPEMHITNTDMRVNVESFHYPTIAPGNVSSKVRPTYAAVNGLGKAGAASEYGNSVIILKPKMKQLATYIYDASDFVMPLKIIPENEMAFVRTLMDNAQKLFDSFRNETIEANRGMHTEAEVDEVIRRDFPSVDDLIAKLDNNQSDLRRAISNFFTNRDLKHANRLEFFETGGDEDKYRETSEKGAWKELVEKLGFGPIYSNGILSNVMLTSCLDKEKMSIKQTDYGHVENLLGNMEDYDEVRTTLALSQGNGDRLVLKGARFIEAQIHKPINMYEDVGEIRFSEKDLPDKARPEGQRLYDETVTRLRQWGEAHGVKITILASNAEDEDANEYARTVEPGVERVISKIRP